MNIKDIKDIKEKGLIATLSIVLFVLFITSLYAAGLPHLFQGVVMENNGASLIVSEKKVLINPGTYVKNSKEQDIRLSDIKPGNHVYVKGEFDDNDNIVAKKIYLLPHRISHKELDNYPFMKEVVKAED
jgi:hypothetical protein